MIVRFLIWFGTLLNKSYVWRDVMAACEKVMNCLYRQESLIGDKHLNKKGIFLVALAILVGVTPNDVGLWFAKAVILPVTHTAQGVIIVYAILRGAMERHITGIVLLKPKIRPWDEDLLTPRGPEPFNRKIYPVPIRDLTLTGQKPVQRLQTLLIRLIARREY